MNPKDKGRVKGKERKLGSGPRLKVLAGGKVDAEAPHAARNSRHGPIVVPQVDAKGVPMPAWRVASWHLQRASQLLLGEYMRERGRDRAIDFERAAAVSMQTSDSLEPKPRPNTDPTDRDRLRRMALESRYRLRTDRSDAERWLLNFLPVTANEAQSEDYWKEMGPEKGAKNLASVALSCLAAQSHADAGKILRRWGVSDSDSAHNSLRFQEDVDALASEIHELLEPSEIRGTTFPRALVRRMYRLLGLGQAFEAEKKKRQRVKLE